MNKYFDPDYINRKATFWVGSDCFRCDILRGIPILQHRNWSTNIYWAPLSETKYTQHRHTHRHTWTLKQIQIGNFSSLPFSDHVVSGLGPWLCRLYSFVLCPSPRLQQTHLASIEYLQQKWPTDVQAWLYFGIVIS